MDLLASFRLATASSVCAVLVACAGTEESAKPPIVRTRAPQGYEKTITNYLAFRIRGPQKNSEISVGAPEPGDCPLDGYLTSSRGWVVPVVYATFSGAPTGKEPININTKQYYFWFLGNTIAGITPRIELCPGVGAFLSEDTQPKAAAGLLTTAFPSAPNSDSQRPEGVDSAEPKASRAQEKVKPARGQKHATAVQGKKTATSSAKTRQAIKKKAQPRGKVEVKSNP
jgi:hypothetical protein